MSIGLGDALLNDYKVTNTAQNIPIRSKGHKPVMPADPIASTRTSGKFINNIHQMIHNMFSSSSQCCCNSIVS